jgi:hypothetical protein
VGTQPKTRGPAWAPSPEPPSRLSLAERRVPSCPHPSWMATQATAWQRRPRQVKYLMASGI